MPNPPSTPTHPPRLLIMRRFMRKVHEAQLEELKSRMQQTAEHAEAEALARTEAQAMAEVKAGRPTTPH